jgi:Rad3-related DNA helicase
MVETFIEVLTTSSDGQSKPRQRNRRLKFLQFIDGRVHVSASGSKGEVEIRYQHLNPSTSFVEVLESARSVILAGGTMSPVIPFDT